MTNLPKINDFNWAKLEGKNGNFKLYTKLVNFLNIFVGGQINSYNIFLGSEPQKWVLTWMERKREESLDLPWFGK